MASSGKVGFDGYARCAPFVSYEQWLSCQTLRAKTGFVQVCYPCRSPVNAASEEDLKSRLRSHFHKHHTVVPKESYCTICCKGTGPHGSNTTMLSQHSTSKSHQRAIGDPNPVMCLTCGTVNPLATHNPEHKRMDLAQALNAFPTAEEAEDLPVGPEFLLLLTASKNGSKLTCKGPCEKHLAEILPQGFQTLKVSVSTAENAMLCNICRLQVKAGLKTKADQALLLIVDPPSFMLKKKPVLKQVLRMSELEELSDEEYDLYDLGVPKRGQATLNAERYRAYIGDLDETDGADDVEAEEGATPSDSNAEAKAEPAGAAPPQGEPRNRYVLAEDSGRPRLI